MTAAAREGDSIEHSSALTGLLVGMAVGAVAAAFIVGTGGLGAVAIVGAVAAVGAGAALGGGIGQLIGSLSFCLNDAGQIKSGSPNVFFNGKPAARAHLDHVECDQHGDDEVLAEGSSTVFINNQPAARVKDRTECDGTIKTGSDNVFVGGGTKTIDGINPEVPTWLQWTVFGIGLASAIVLTGGVVIPIAATGGGLAGGVAAYWAGGKVFGEGSDMQKISAFGGAALGGGLGARGGKWFDSKYEFVLQGGSIKVLPRTPAKVASIAKSEAAHGRAMQTKDELPKSKEYKLKTVSSNEKKTISGWSEKKPPGYEKISAEKVKYNSELIGHEMKSHPYDRDFKGQYYSSHAEKQMSITSQNHPIGVSKPMCTDCQGYFSKLATYNRTDQIVTDPKAVRIFKPDGSIETIPRAQ